jgi:hypothetical protein
MQDLIPQLPECNTPSFVWYADKPLRQGGIPRKISIQELVLLTGNDFTFIENIFYFKHFQPNLSSLHSNSKIQSAVLSRLKNPLIDKLVICYMGLNVGHGVFAREDISLGDIVAIYSGELKKKSNTNTESAYSLDIDTQTGSGNYYIDAKNYGGIARFIQHLPLNSTKLADKLISSFKANTSLVRTYMELTTASDDFSPAEREMHITGMTQDVIFNNGMQFREMLNYKAEIEQGRIDRDWEAKQTEFHSTNITIAYCNLAFETVIINNKPIIYFWAECNIAAGEQLGFSYGIGYWANLGFLPLYFDDKGGIIPKQNYTYKQMPFAIDTSQGIRLFTYDKNKYYQSLNNPTPVKFSAFAQPISFFYIRKQLAMNNVISGINLPLFEPNTFTLALIKLIGDQFIIEAYERKPESNIQDERYIIDVVCKAKSKGAWNTLVAQLKTSQLHNHCLYYTETDEIIIRGVNVNTNLAYDFIQKLSNQHIPTLSVNNSSK